MKFTIALAVASVFIVGCSADHKAANKGNFKTAIQAYLDSTPGLCFTPPDTEIPFKISATPWPQFRGGPTPQFRADVLVDVGLLSRRDAMVPGVFGKPEPGFEYSATEAGAKVLVSGAGNNVGRGPGFCMGKYRVSEVTGFTEPADAMGMKISKVIYTYGVEGAPDWVKRPEILKANPNVAPDLDPKASKNAVLILTNDGWVHERVFRAKAPMGVQ